MKLEEEQTSGRDDENRRGSVNNFPSRPHGGRGGGHYPTSAAAYAAAAARAAFGFGMMNYYGHGGGGGSGGGWAGYGGYPYISTPPLPIPPFMHRPSTFVGGHGTSRPLSTLGVQRHGIIKRPSGPPQNTSFSGRGRGRVSSGRGWGGRGQRNLTKEALDADLDQWRMKDKRSAGQSLDAELDEYWRKKESNSEEDRDDGEAHPSPKQDGQDGSSLEVEEASCMSDQKNAVVGSQT